MNLKLFYLIHSEGNNRYYYQPINAEHPNRPYLLRRLKINILRWIAAFKLPFNPVYNTQQFDNQLVRGGQKVKA